jgi:hypothetical protein
VGKAGFSLYLQTHPPYIKLFEKARAELFAGVFLFGVVQLYVQ